jgi:nitrate reductase NapE component
MPLLRLDVGGASRGRGRSSGCGAVVLALMLGVLLSVRVVGVVGVVLWVVDVSEWH